MTKIFTKTIFRVLLFALILLADKQAANASHMAGGEIQYSCIGLRQWKVTLTLYRYCDGIPLCPSFACTKTVTASPSSQISAGGLNPNGCSGPPVSLTVPLVKVEDVGKDNITRCGLQSKNACTNLGQVTAGSYQPSIEKYVFEGILDMSSPAYANVCPYYDLYFTDCCRNSTTNVNGQPYFGFQATINIHNNSGSNCKNNAPVFKNDATAIFCAGQEAVFNLGANDPDGDSLTYEIVKSLQTLNGPVTYIPPYNEYVPFQLNQTLPPHAAYPWSARVVLDTLTGDVSFNPKNTGLTPIPGDISIKVTQWNYSINSQTGAKTPVIVGTTMRNLQIYSIPCLLNNQPKLITNPALPNGKPKLHHTVCAGEQICFTVTAKDTDYKPLQTPPRIDTTYLSWDESIVRTGKISFLPDYDTTQARPREDRYQFCWQTDSADGRSLPYYFTIKAMDNFCPNPGKVVQAFSITVGGSHLPGDLIKTQLNCGKWKLQIRKTNGLDVLNSATLQVAKIPNDFTFSGGSFYQASANPNPAGTGNAPRVIITDSFTFTLPGKYLVKYTLGTNCSTVYYDTIFTSFENVRNNTTDTLKCKGSAVPIGAAPGGGTSPYTYKWFNMTGGNPISTNSQIISNDNVNTTYLLEVKDSAGCRFLDTIQVKIKTIQPSGLIDVNDSSQCVTADAFVFNHKPVAGFSNYTRTWSSDLSSSTDSLFLMNYSTSGTKNVRLIIKELNGCSDTTYRTVLVTAVPSAKNTIIINDSDQCITGNLFRYSYNRVAGNTYKWQDYNNYITDSVLFKSYPQTGTYDIKLIVGDSACADTAIRQVVVNHQPPVKALIKINDSTQCIEGNQFKYSYMRILGVNYKWKEGNNYITDSIINRTYLQLGVYQISLIAGDSACADTAVQNVFVSGKPVSPPGIAVNDSVQCVTGNQFKFNHQHTPSYKYYWLYDFTMKQDSLLQVSYGTTGVKEVKLITGYEGCFDTIARKVRTTSKPVVSNIISVNQQVQCVATNNYLFTHNGVNDSARFKFTWFSPDTTVTSYSFNTRLKTAGLKKIKLLVWEPSGCCDTAFAQVSVTPVPVAAGTIKVNDSIQCINNNQFRLSYNKSAGAVWKWIYNNTTSTDSAIILTSTVIGENKVKLMVGAPGCSDTTTMTLTTTAVPVANNDILASSNGQCLKGNQFSFSYVPKPLTEYKWIYNGNTSKSTVLNLNYTDSGTQTIKLMLGEPGCSDTAVKQIQVWPQPVTKNVLTINDSSQCAGNNNFVLTYNSSNNPYHYSHVWLSESGNSVANPIQLNYTNEGQKNVSLILTTQQSCKDTIVKQLVVEAAPVKPIILGTTTGIKINDEVNYLVTSQAGYSYKWWVTNGVFLGTDTAATVRVKWSVAGTGKLKVENKLNNCSSNDSLDLTVGSVGLKEEAGLIIFNIHPNPNRGSFNILLNAQQNGKATVKLYNILGEEVLSQQHELVSGENNVGINVSVQPGIYLVMIKKGESITTQKITVYN